jgi:kynurenine 3-monooxygenase
MQTRALLLGGGLVGSLLSCFLARRGFQVSVMERRPDWRQSGFAGGRSINLALSDRGWAALQKLELDQDVRKLALPMTGRMIHQINGNTQFLPYSDGVQAIYSVSRAKLNALLAQTAIEKFGVNFQFDKKCIALDLNNTSATLQNADGTSETVSADIIFGSDGAFSELRSEMMRQTKNFNYSQQFESHGYKELTIPPNADGSHKINPGALHIWPRDRFMMIALPNTDGSFTCTLFAPYTGEDGLDSLTSEKEILRYFQLHFPDALPLMPGLTEEFLQNPTSSLVTIKCFPWVKNRSALIGDAAHAIVPFYGQGMNCGFEDVRILDELLNQNLSWEDCLNQYQSLRKTDADAIADLALYNFIEMRDLSGKASFQFRMQLEKHLALHFPDQFKTLYSMVTFSPEIRYSEALAKSRKQAELLDHLMQREDISENWNSSELLRYAENWLNLNC